MVAPIDNARRYEDEASLIRKKDSSDPRLLSIYEKAGDYRGRLGDVKNIHWAIKNYNSALSYTRDDEDAGRIEAKIENARTELAKRQMVGMQLKRSMVLSGHISPPQKPKTSRKYRGALEDRLYLFITAIAFFVIALFFSLFSLTGNAVGFLNNDDFRWMGLLLFVAGLVFTFVYFAGKKNKKNKKNGK